MESFIGKTVLVFNEICDTAWLGVLDENSVYSHRIELTNARAITTNGSPHWGRLLADPNFRGDMQVFNREYRQTVLPAGRVSLCQMVRDMALWTAPLIDQDGTFEKILEASQY